ncbi:MAG: hypothetical protein KDH88_09830 [Chromatiales bacterium]|nr:hypothetical protein [Chromatiales bacterium]
MIDPVDLNDFFVGFFASAMVVVAGALYAGTFAWSRLRALPRLMPWAYVAYAVLFVSLLVLSSALNLSGYWRVLLVLLLLGYLLAPHAIWHLCRGTHGEQTPGEG